MRVCAVTALNSTSPLILVFSGNRCLGFLLRRNRMGVEAFDVNDQSLGLFTSERDAIAALMSHTPREPPNE
jgi:hypothetical protein